MLQERIVITGIGLTSPLGNDLASFREKLLAGESGVSTFPVRNMGDQPAGVCDFEQTKYQKRKEVRIGTRAGGIGIYCAHEALANAGLSLSEIDPSKVGVYLGITEHGNVETETEVCQLFDHYSEEVKYWSHHHNPRTVANNPAGEITINLGLTGPHYTVGAACAAGNAGIIQGVQMLSLGECDWALAGGVSESIRAYGIFAGFKSQGALAAHEDPTKASRPFDRGRNGIVVSEGGCIYVLERLKDALKRGANIIAEIMGYRINSDGTDYVLPNPERQEQCIRQALDRAEIEASMVDLVSSHATSTPQGDEQECKALRNVFSEETGTLINNTKSFIGHSMGAAGALELAGNIPSFIDGTAHGTINLDDLDPSCALPGLVMNEAKEKKGGINVILNNSFGMLGINSVLILKKFVG
ncbi:beta-ketoacyl-[acyl-carrier-protein] synthase family protein [Opitutales bacterium]|jgi:3-oxoacyl-[acyl-carrier-protein] synthase II|nr:beta-ketoacyl-[acyl-carrier-protein] synthase family protein [Opitutales bacterium]